VSDEQTQIGNGVKARAPPENSREGPAGRSDYCQKSEGSWFACGNIG